MAAGSVAPVQAAIELEGVSVWRWHEPTRSRRVAAHRIDWTVRAGETWALLGPNGSGKTTLLGVAAAVDFPSRGRVTILGERLGATDVPRLRERIGLVDSRLAPRFSPGLTVTAVVETGATGTIGWFPERIDDAARERARSLLDLFGLVPLADRRLAELSNGERMRTLVARALVPRPALLLLDEPGAGLDLPGRETLLQALARLAADEPTLATVMTTHHLEELPSTTTHALLLREGSIVAAGPIGSTLDDSHLTRCFGLPVTATRNEDGRWRATGQIL